MESQKTVTKLQEMVHELTVGDVMSRELITVASRARVRDLRELLRANRISGVPVVEEERLVGIISVEDFIKCLADRENGCRIEEKMARDVETLQEDDSLVSAIRKFEILGFGRFPVIERSGGRLVGIMTKGDVIKGLLKQLETEYIEEEAHHYRAHQVLDEIEADTTTLLFDYDVRGGDFQRAGEGSSCLKRTLKRLGIPPDVARRVAIASYEAEMNLAIFTEGGTLGVRVQPTEIILKVTDAGPGIADVEKALQPGYSTASDWVRELGFGAGMGLPNMQSMSDEFRIESRLDEGTTLEILFHTDEVQHEAE